MNFKQVYKEANDEIHGSDALLGKILSAPGKRVFRIPTVIPVVAVAAMIAVVIAVPNFLKHDIQSPSSDIRVVQSGDAGEQHESSEITEPEVSKEPVVENPATVEIFEPESQPVYDGSYDVPEEIPVTTEENFDVIAVNYVSQLAGAEASVMSRGIPEKPQTEMTAEEYVRYIGKDVAAISVIPDDMTMESPEFVSAKTDGSGKIIGEKATYFAHSEDYERFAEINVTRTQNILIPEENLEKSVICGNQVIIVSDNTDYNASFSENDVQYFIRCGGVTENELTNLLISLNGGSTNEQEDFSRNNGSSDGSFVTGNDDGIGR